MVKKTILLCLGLILLGSTLAAQQGDELINGIFLIKNPNEIISYPPQHIRIGIDMAAQAYFKLLNEEMIISAGILHKGMNSLSIPSDTFFDKTDKFTLHLELKRGIIITRKDIVLDIQLAVMEKPEKEIIGKSPSEYKISLFIEDQLISTKIKQVETVPSIQQDLAQVQPPDNPFYVPKETDNLMRNTVSIIDALLMGYQLIKSVAKKKNREEPELALQHTHSLAIKFLRKNPQGVEEEVIAMIELTTK